MNESKTTTREELLAEAMEIVLHATPEQIRKGIEAVMAMGQKDQT